MERACKWQSVQDSILRVNQLHGARMALTSTSSCLHIPRPITLEVPDMIAFATRITLKREGDAKLS